MLAQDCAVTVACEIRGIARSSYHCQAAEARDEAERKDAIKETATGWPTCGYRCITEQLKRRGLAVKHRGVWRLMPLMDIHGKNEHKKKPTTDSGHGVPRSLDLVLDMQIVRPDQASYATSRTLACARASSSWQ